MRRIYILLVFLLSCYLGEAQSFSYSQYVKAAEKAMLTKDYYSALSFYNDAISFEKGDLGVLYQAAEAARLFNSYNLAAERYNAVIESESNGEYPLSSFWLGDINQRMGDYEQAKSFYNMYLSEHEGEDAFYTQKAQKEIAASDWAIGIVQNPDENIAIEHLEAEVNSPYSDFAPVLLEDGLVFSSLRFDQEDVELPASLYSKVLKVNGTGVEDYDENINEQNILTAHSAFNINKSRIFYTVCDYVNIGEVQCDLYYRPVLGDGTLGNEVKLPDGINQATSTSTQPSVGFNEALGKEVLYFVSDRTGGEGKLDIWYTTLEGADKYGAVMNLGSVNTADNDITPSFHNASQVLYFSSEGYLSLGGYDVYRSNLDDGVFGKPEHLGYPMNSSYEDIYYNLSDDTNTAHFSSNRMGSLYLEESEEACCAHCFDIYEMDIGDIELNLNALTFDKNTLEDVNGATVRLICVATGEEEGVVTNLDGNDHRFLLRRGKEYKIVVEHPDYIPADPVYFSTMRAFRSEEIIKKIYLERAPNPYDLQVLTFDQLTTLALNGVTVTMEDMTDQSIQTITLTHANSNDYLFEVIKGHSYKVTGSKSGYYDASISFVANYAEGETRLIKRLYLQPRIPELYLPLTLYFDNDIPDRRSRLITTNRTYTQTYNAYIVLKEEFKQKYSETLEGTNKALAESRVEEFFEGRTRPGRYRNGVRVGYNRFQLFLSTMLNEISAGRSFELAIRGYASPRAATKYNAALSQRRVESIKNELRAYAGGALSRYIDDGRLVITELAFGETTSPPVSDRLYDLRNSWYAPEASQERRVEIERVTAIGQN